MGSSRTVRAWVTIAIATTVAACGGGHQAAKAGTATAPVAAKDPPPPTEPAQSPLLADLTVIRDDACACTDAPCAEGVERALEAWGRKYSNFNGSQEEVMATGDLSYQINDCLGEATETVGGAATASASASDLSELPNCDLYVRTVRAFLACDKVSAKVRESARQGLEAMESGWGSMEGVPIDVIKQTDAACAQALDGLHQGMDAMGCPY